MNQVNVKLAPEADPKEAVAHLADLPGVAEIVQTFPGEQDEELSKLYLVGVDDPDLDATLDQLRQRPDVEYAEAAAPRKLIR